MGQVRYDRRGKSVYGKGINDANFSMKVGRKQIPSYNWWCNMLYRCYSDAYLEKHHTYIGCSVCEDWLKFSKFAEWFEQNYVDGYALDKDIIKKGNKVYSPETCCFVPKEINLMLTACQGQRGRYPVGVSLNKQTGKFHAKYSINGKTIYIGAFDDPNDAFDAYKEARERHIKDVAQNYFNSGKITERVYNALKSYEVLITD